MTTRNGIISGDFAIVSFEGISTQVICFEIPLNSIVSIGGNFLGLWAFSGTVDGFCFCAQLPIIQANPLEVSRRLAVGRSFICDNGMFKIMGLNFPLGAEAYNRFSTGKFYGCWVITQHSAGVTLSFYTQMVFANSQQVRDHPQIRSILNYPLRRETTRRAADYNATS